MNLLKIGFSYFLSLFGIGTSFSFMPISLSVEPANFCQLHCPECPVGLRTNTRLTPLKLELETFKKTIDELKNTLLHVIFYFQGEPLLNAQLSDFILYAHKSKLYSTVSTNAQLLTHDVAKKFVSSGLDKLIISIDGTTQEVYQTYRKGGQLQKALEGVEFVLEWRRKLGSATPLVEIQFLVVKTNEHQLTDMKLLAERLHVDKLTFKSAQLYEFELGNELLPKNKKYARYKQGSDGRFYVKSHQPNHCWRLWSGAVVTASGDVLPCCFDKSAEFVFGNVHTAGFAACWHNKKAADFRAKILQNRLQFEMCRNCTSAM